MLLPEFPDSREITIEDKPLFDAAFAAQPPEVSAYTFTNIFAWRESHHDRLSGLGDSLIVHREVDGTAVFLQPIGGDPIHAMRRIAEVNGAPVEFERISRRVADRASQTGDFEATADRDNFDYIYRASDLINLPGRKYDGKRNFIARARAENDCRYVTMDRELAILTHDFAKMWCEERVCHTVQGLLEEQCAVYQMLTHFDELGIRGGAIKINGRIAAFSLGEALNPETMVVHVEKADASITGLYQLINNEFCIHETAGYEFVNREQDLGIPGLRKAKESYQPVRMTEVYRVRPNSNTVHLDEE